MAIKFNDIDAYIDYFEGLARSNASIRHDSDGKHFFAFDAAEIETEFRQDINFPALVIEHNDGNIQGPNLAQLNERVRCAFWIVTGPVEKENFVEIRSALKQSKVLGYQILSKMHKDSLDRTLQGFDVKTVSFLEIGPLWDMYYYRWEFEVIVNINEELCYDENDWDE